MTGSAAFWEKWKSEGRGEGNFAWRFWKTLLGTLKSGVAEIAAARSSREFGREEEKE
ncbi:MAG TPA: hypothetical protein VJO16_09570 [Candidatus Acidoferrum sp.]|nr:hypothetical protein [Candidatus Acidoferrum sp.]